jgi:hypothetical protein
MAQTVSTTPRHHFYQNNGELAAGGTLEIFEANTITHAVTWFDRDGTVAHQNANPLTLDSQGAAVVWLEAGKVYDWLARDLLGNIIDNAKGITGSTSAISSSSQWIVTALTPSFVNTRTFTIVGDQTATYKVGRRVRITLTGGFKYGTIISSVFSTLTTVTVGFASASDVLDSTITAVDIGLDDTETTAFMLGSGSVIDLTGYSGADVKLGIGQSAVYDVTATTSIPLRIATGDKQGYELWVLPDEPGGAGMATAVTTPQLAPNNAGAIVFANTYSYAAENTPSALKASNGFVVLGTAFTPIGFMARISTCTKSKQVHSSFYSLSNVANFAGIVNNYTGDTTTVWSSLGTINVNTMTGRVMVKRVM